MAEVTYSRGLAGVIADESKICTIDGVKGELYYCGYPIQTLAKESHFTETAYLLFYSKLPTSSQLKEFESKLSAASEIPGFVYDLIRTTPKGAHPMRTLQAAVAALGMDEPVNSSHSWDEHREIAIRLTGAFSTLIAAIGRHRDGKDFVSPRSDLSHAANFLYMLTGEEPDAKIAKMFDTCLLLHAEHTFNASTFTGRVVASTQADLYTAISSAVGALYGPLHGGANERVLHMVDEIGGVDNLQAWFENAMETKKKVMGMGHRVYKTIDPRAKILKGMLTVLAEEKGDTSSLEVLNQLADLMAKKMEESGKEIWPNVDFYSGTLYTLMGIEPIHYTPIFALARVSGWAAHCLELWTDSRLYRPKAHYVGDIDLEYTPIDSRS